MSDQTCVNCGAGKEGDERVCSYCRTPWPRGYLFGYAVLRPEMMATFEAPKRPVFGWVDYRKVYGLL